MYVNNDKVYAKVALLFKMILSSSLSCPSRPALSLPATVTEYSPSDVRSVMFSELLLSVVL